jgi:hypothetical protein
VFLSNKPVFSLDANPNTVPFAKPNTVPLGCTTELVSPYKKEKYILFFNLKKRLKAL